MSLLRPTPGEIADRLGIVFRKLVEGNWAGKATAHWVEEYQGLWDLLKDIGGVMAPLDHSDFWLKFLELFAVNMALWDAEDAVRHRLSCRDDRFDLVPIYEKIKAFNDQRSKLIHDIDLLFDPNAPQEKLH